jgi:hypothetical protein
MADKADLSLADLALANECILLPEAEMIDDAITALSEEALPPDSQTR